MLHKQRHYVSGILSRCVSFDVCSKKGIGERFCPGTSRVIPVFLLGRRLLNQRAQVSGRPAHSDSLSGFRAPSFPQLVRLNAATLHVSGVSNRDADRHNPAPRANITT